MLKRNVDDTNDGSERMKRKIAIDGTTWMLNANLSRNFFTCVSLTYSYCFFFACPLVLLILTHFSSTTVRVFEPTSWSNRFNNQNLYL